METWVEELDQPSVEFDFDEGASGQLVLDSEYLVDMVSAVCPTISVELTSFTDATPRGLKVEGDRDLVISGLSLNSSTVVNFVNGTGPDGVTALLRTTNVPGGLGFIAHTVSAL
eukprot:3180960-Amphidinium_carterae.1